MDPITIFKGTTGLNTVLDPVRIPMMQNGINDVSEMVNLKVDESGRPSKRKGLIELTSGSFHSLYCDKGDCFVAQDRTTDTAIYQVAADGTTVGVRSGLQINERISFKQHIDKTYYANGYQTGIIEGGVSDVWESGTYHGVETDRAFDIPAGINHLEIHNGRMYASADNILWWSEPFRFDLFDMARSFVMYSSNIRLVKQVAGGVYVSTEQDIFFVTGGKPNEFQQRHVASFPAIEWSAAIDYVDGADIGFEPGLCALWTSSEGAILGTPGGQIINLTKEKIIYPEDVKTGFGCLMGYNFIHGMN